MISGEALKNINDATEALLRTQEVGSYLGKKPRRLSMRDVYMLATGTFDPCSIGATEETQPALNVLARFGKTVADTEAAIERNQLYVLADETPENDPKTISVAQPLFEPWLSVHMAQDCGAYRVAADAPILTAELPLDPEKPKESVQYSVKLGNLAILYSNSYGGLSVDTLYDRGEEKHGVLTARLLEHGVAHFPEHEDAINETADSLAGYYSDNMKEISSDVLWLDPRRALRLSFKQ